MRHGIALFAFGSRNWIGGVYYIKNIAFQLSQNTNINNNYQIYVFTNPELIDEFASLPVGISIIKILGGKKNLADLYANFIRFHIEVVYPVGRTLPFVNNIEWIPDFQYKYYSNFFSEKEIIEKNKDILKLSGNNKRLILSSFSCLTDLNTFFPENKAKIEIMHFVSYIEPTIRSIEPYENDILRKFNLKKGQYACVMNQFWKHKNHKEVFEAIKYYYTTHEDDKFTFVFTGEMKDYRNPGYIEQLKELTKNRLIAEHINILGFISRNEQIAIMKNAAYVIQPSLFEGWGTVLEDAKVLDKTILLSDIPVHREQMNEKCVLFNPHDPIALAKLIEDENLKEHKDNVSKGIKDMYERAEEYSKGFERMLKSI